MYNIGRPMTVQIVSDQPLRTQAVVNGSGGTVKARVGNRPQSTEAAYVVQWSRRIRTRVSYRLFGGEGNDHPGFFCLAMPTFS